MKHGAQPRLLIPALFFALAFAVFGIAAAQQAPPAKIGYVDMKRLLDSAPQVIAGRRRLEHEFAPRDTALKTDEARLAGLRSRYDREAALMTKDKADALKREIDALDRSLKRSRDAMRNDLKTRSDQELDRSWREINNAVVEFARDEGYDLIVPSPVVYASPRMDITDAVLDRLKRRYQAQRGSQ